jgi:hypothetical protein
MIKKCKPVKITIHVQVQDANELQKSSKKKIQITTLQNPNYNA